MVRATDATDITPSRRPSSPPALQWLQGGGEMAERISAFNWAETPLGPLERWPQSLRTSVSLMVSSQHPMWIGWGPQATFLYNDAYVSVLSRAKHPWALGRPAAEVWAEIWNVCGPLADKVFERAEASFVDDVELFMNRGDFVEETYYSFSYSPIRDESGQVGGLFCPSAEVSSKVLNARRLATLSELTANSLLERTVEGACASAFATLAKNPKDLPFAVLYLFRPDGPGISCEAVAGIRGGHPLAALRREPGPNEPIAPWPVRDIIELGHLMVLPLPLDADLPPGPAMQRLRQAVGLPVTARGYDRPLGVLIAGVNPARQLDAEYRTFYELVASQLATAIQNARAVEENRRRAEALAELDRAKTTFFSNVSHELRTPLTLMLGPIEDIINGSDDEASDRAASRELATLAHRNGLRLLKLVNALLDFSRMEAGRMQALFEPVPLGTFTAELASTFRSAVERAGLALVVDCPPLSEPAYVDRDHWEKIVLNLLSNAFKFTLTGEIRVAVVETSAGFRLEVRDTGVGIPTEAQRHLFERFYRVEGTGGRTQEGTGIGLALVRDLVRLHGGAIAVESEPGRGSTFVVEIPRGNAHLAADRVRYAATGRTTALGARPFVEEAQRWLPDEAEATSDPALRGAAAQTVQGRILLVDDNADMRDYVRRLLTPQFQVTTATDGLEALDLLGREPFDLVLSDVMMPRLDGFGLVKTIREDPDRSALPIILLSARAGEEARVAGIARGADDYLVKPFSARELVARVSTHLHLAQLRKEAEAKIRLAERRLRDTRARLEATLADAAVGTWLWDMANNRLLGDPSLFRLFSLAHPDEDEPVPLDALLPAIHPEDRPRVQGALERALRGGARSFEEDYRVVQPDGSHRWIASRGRLQQDGADAPVMRGVLIDITERKELEKERSRLFEQEQQARHRAERLGERLSFSLGAMQLGDWSWNPDTDEMSCSARTLEIFGLPLEARITREQMRRSLHPDDRDNARNAARVALETATDYDIEYRVMHPARGLRWVLAKGRPLFDAAGRVTSMMGVVQDITEHKKAELQLRKQRDVLAQILSGAPLPEILESLTLWAEENTDRPMIATILLADGEGRALHPAAGGRAPAAWSRYIQTVPIGPAVGSCGTAAYRREPVVVEDIASDPLWKDFRVEALKHDLRACWSSPILAAQGAVLGTFAIYYPEPTKPTAHEGDLVAIITRAAAIAIERKRAEEDLAASRRELQEHAALLERTVEERTAKLRETIGELEAFSYSISHDMRAPLRAMQGYANLLLRDCRSKFEAREAEFLERINKNASRLELLVRDVLAYSKVSKEEISLSRVDLAAFVPSLLGQVADFQRPDIEIVVRQPLPPVWGHEAYLSQVFTNLVGNAIKFATPGVPAVIEIAAEARDGVCRITVRDNGIGIDPAHFPRIFEIFGRVYPDKKFEGTGIGLSIVKKAVQRMGGSAGVESALGKGSTFWFTLRSA